MKNLIVVFMLAAVTVALFISGIVVIAATPTISHITGQSTLIPQIVMTLLLFGTSIVTAIALNDVIKNADRVIVNFDDDDAYQQITELDKVIERQKQFVS